MTYELNDLKRLLILVLFYIPAITSTNVDCRGKAFHCVNSTHFMICVDLGGGISTTIDDFVIPCPPTTVCHERNIFECEFPKIEVTTPALRVIGVSKQSDISVTTSVINSVTTVMPPIVSVKENITKNTSPRAEEVTFAPKWEVLESLKEPTGIKNESSTEGTIVEQVSPNSTNNQNNIVNVEQVNDNRQEIPISIVDDKNLESAVESSIDKAVTASLTDKYKSIDTATLANGLIDLMYNNSETLVDTTSAYELTFVNNIATTAHQNISKQVINTENITDNFTKPNVTTLTNNTYKIVNLNNTIPLVFMTTQSLDQDDMNKQIDYTQLDYSDNHNVLTVNPDIKSDTTTTEVPETYTTFFKTTKTEFIKEPKTISDSPENITVKIFNRTSDENITNFSPSERTITTDTNDLINLYQFDIKSDKPTTSNYNIDTKYPASASNISLTKTFFENVTASILTPILATYKDIDYVTIVGTSQNESSTFIMEEIKNKSTTIPITDDSNANVKLDSRNVTLRLEGFTNKSTGYLTETTAAKTTNYSILEQISHESVINQNNATTVIHDGNNTAMINNHHTSIPDIFIDQATESTLIPMKTTEFVTLLNESNKVTKVEESKLDLPAIFVTGDQNKLDPFGNSTTHNNLTTKSNETIQSQTPLLDIFTVASSDIATDISTLSKSKNVINNQENKNQDTFELQVLLDKLNVEKNAETTLNLESYEKTVTSTILPTTLVEPISVLKTNLSINVNLDNHKNKTKIDLGKMSSLNKAPQTTPQPLTIDNYNTEFTTTNAPVILNTTTVSTNGTKQLITYPEITENMKSTTGHEIEINITSFLDVTHTTTFASTNPVSATINKTTTRINSTTKLENTPEIVENVTLIINHKMKNHSESLSLLPKDKILTTAPQKITAINNTNSPKQVNTDRITSESGSDSTSSVSTEKYTDVYMSDQINSMQLETTIPDITLGQYQELNTSTTIQPIFGNNVNISTTTYEVNAHKDDNVKINPLLEANNPFVMLPDVISTLSSLNTDSLINGAKNNLTSPSVIDYVKTTASYTDMNTYRTTTYNNSIMNIQTPQTIEIFADKLLTNHEITAGRTESFEKTHIENVKDIPITQTPLSSTGESDSILPGSNTVIEYFLTTENIKLPDVTLEEVTLLSNDTKSITEKLFISTVSPLSLKTSIIKPSTEESIRTTTTAPMTRSNLVTLTQNTNEGLRTYFEELPTITTEVIETQTVYQDTKLFSESTVTAAPLSTSIPEPQPSALFQNTLTNLDFNGNNKIAFNLVTEKTSVVETLESNVTKTSGPILGDLILGEVNETINSTNYSESKGNENVNGVLFNFSMTSTNISEKSVNTENVNLKIANDQITTAPKVSLNKIVLAETTTNLPNINADIELQNILKTTIITENVNLTIANDQITIAPNMPFDKILTSETTNNLLNINIDTELQNISKTPVKTENLKIANAQMKTIPNVPFNKIVPAETTTNFPNTNLKIAIDPMKTTPNVLFSKIFLVETTSNVPNINSDIERPNISETSVNNENVNLKIANDQIKTAPNVPFNKIVPAETTTNLPTINSVIELRNISENAVTDKVNLKIANDQVRITSHVPFKKTVPDETTANLPKGNSEIKLQNKISMDKIESNEATTVKLKYVPITVTTSAFYMITTKSGFPGYTTQRPIVITDENVTKNSLNTNIKIPDTIQTRLLTNSTFVSRNDNIIGVKTHSTNNTHKLNENSGHNSTLSNNHHPEVTNLSHVPEIRTKSNATGNQINSTTSNVEKLKKTNLNNSYTRTVNTKLNTSYKHNITVNIAASPFNCSNYTRGKYADKNDCRKFYTCVGNRVQPILGICPNNTVFSEINKQCTRNLSHCVRNNQFKCLLEGRFSDFFKDNIYYICVKNSENHFLRYKLQCQNNYHLDKAIVKCVKNLEIPNLSASSVSENSKVNNDESESPNIVENSTKATTRYDFECEDEGKFANSDDCRKYYVCTKTITGIYRRKIKQCSSEEVYNEEKKECVESDSCES